MLTRFRFRFIFCKRAHVNNHSIHNRSNKLFDSSINCIYPVEDQHIVPLLQHLSDSLSSHAGHAHTRKHKHAQQIAHIYPYLHQIFVNKEMCQIYGQYLFSLLIEAKYCPSVLLQFVDKSEIHLLTNLMLQFAQLADHKSCQTIFDWLSSTTTNTNTFMLSIDHCNMLLQSFSSNNTNIDDAIAVNHSTHSSQNIWNVWHFICKHPGIVFDDETIRHFLTLFANKNEKLKFVQQLLTKYRDILSEEMWIEILPFMNLNLSHKHNTANGNPLNFELDLDSILSHQNTNFNVKIAMIENICYQTVNGKDKYLKLCNIVQQLQQNEKIKAMNEHKVRLVCGHLTAVSNLNPHMNLKHAITHYLLPRKWTKYENLELEPFVNALLEVYNHDNIYTAKDIENNICKEFLEYVSIPNWHKLIALVQGKSLLQQQNTGFMFDFLTNKVFAKNHHFDIKGMDFKQVLLCFQGLSVVDRFKQNNRSKRLINSAVLIALQERLTNLQLCRNHTDAHTYAYTYRFEEINNDILNLLAKNRIYSHRMLSVFLGNELLLNLKCDKVQRQLTFADLTSLMMNLRHLHFYQKSLYSYLAFKLQKRADLINIKELREWCLCFGCGGFVENSIWLSIQAIIMFHFPTANDIQASSSSSSSSSSSKMPTDILVDLIWSMAILDFIPNYDWILQELFNRMNGMNASAAELSSIHQIRIWEIIQALYANPMHCHLLFEDNIHPAMQIQLKQHYEQSLELPFHAQCKQRKMLTHVCDLLLQKGIRDFRIGRLIPPSMILCDIVIEEHKIAIEIVDEPQMTYRSQSRTFEWIKFRGRREITNRLLKKEGWSVLVVTRNDFEQNLMQFHLWLDRFLVKYENQKVTADANNKKHVQTQAPGVMHENDSDLVLRWA